MQDFKKTLKQKEAISLLGSKARYIMLYGGSRSGKTFIIIYAILIRALKCAQSRHVILRLKFNHVKTSIWLDTLPKVIRLCFPEVEPLIISNASDYYVKLPNGSEIWVAGLDDKIRTEKILGKEYSTIFFNESSQIPYGSIQMAMTRLAQKNNLVKKIYYDENPPQKSHWSYALFIKNRDPETWDTKDSVKYASLLMNPSDNMDNIDNEYITEILEQLAPKEKSRFLEGQFQDASEGAIYYAFNSEKHIKDISQINSSLKMGCDFNVNPITAVAGYYQDRIFYIDDEIYLLNSNTFMLAKEAFKKFNSIDCYPDSTGKARKTSSQMTDHQILKEAGFIMKPTFNPHVKDRQNAVNSLFGNDRLFISHKCRWLIRDLEQLTHENKDPMLSHISDALGYLIWGLEPMVGKNTIRTYNYA